VKTKAKFIVRILLIISGIGTLSTLIFNHSFVAEAFGMMFRDEEILMLTWVKAGTALLGVLFLLMAVNPEKHKVLMVLCSLHSVFMTLYTAFNWIITGKECQLVLAIEGILSVLLVTSFLMIMSLPKKPEFTTERMRMELNEDE
jgi:predicted membrane metal-binding protein